MVPADVVDRGERSFSMQCPRCCGQISQVGDDEVHAVPSKHKVSRETHPCTLRLLRTDSENAMKRAESSERRPRDAECSENQLF